MPFLRQAPLLMAALVAVSVNAQPVKDVVIRDYRFEPQEIRIRAGDPVRWVNHEKRTSHSVLFPAENGLESERLFPGEAWQRTFVTPGEYPYICGPHPEMKGRVIVEPRQQSPD